MMTKYEDMKTEYEDNIDSVESRCIYKSGRTALYGGIARNCKSSGTGNADSSPLYGGSFPPASRHKSSRRRKSIL